MSQSKPVLPQNDNVAHALAGAGGGVLSMALTYAILFSPPPSLPSKKPPFNAPCHTDFSSYPLITLSTRAQVESRRASSDFLSAVRSIVQREGISGLYSGMSSALFGISVTNFVYYYWYEWTRAFFEAAKARAGRSSRKLTTVESMIAGAIAGSATVILTNPIWVVNTRMTTRKSVGTGEEGKKEITESREKKEGEVIPAPATAKKETKPPSTIGTLLALLRTEGPQALFAGVVPALVLVINPILQYTLFEQMKNAVERRKRRVTPTVAFFLGALGKLFATTVTYPYITVKSQMHVKKAGEKKEGVTEALRRVVREEGYAGLYKGIGPKVTQSVLTAAFLFAFKDVLYEYSVRLRRSVAKKGIAA
ncbi:putative peroxisomal membrane protein [Thermochaetoides thermophila DSM 1495]|uniref:Putative peroxisomal membrane protein n=1 Tax=Chaetomium thermophilum (strain DSM 1495 / CBS 144.50 / IMI 039719) TaxID=759272 RepID=G0RYM3_CHATD|nr:putative peroxisomal membrane protein [Thermochaetoides thermophila DSM 1495]EGS24009.1 putative peroxisomal membrane protein [Thermochaetoides thermophila DSM 1495]